MNVLMAPITASSYAVTLEALTTAHVLMGTFSVATMHLVLVGLSSIIFML